MLTCEGMWVLSTLTQQ